MVRTFLRAINVSLLLLIIVSLFCSCTGETNIIDGNNNKQINFSVSVPEWKNTDSLSSSKTSRATPITDNSFGADKSFNLIADQNDGAGNYTALIDNESVSFTNNLWQTNPSHYYWSGIANKTINFYAYYPTSISTSITHTAGSSPTLSYTVPDNVSNQIDIITATGTNISGNTNSSIPLTFNHIFAAVKFAVGTNGLPSGTIKSITISGIKNSGTYTFGSGWTPSSTTSSFTVSPSTAITGSAGVNITSDAYTLMMIPQVFSNAIVSLVYNNGTTFSTTISGTWNAGNSYTYNLSKTVISNFAYTGASQTFTAPYTGTYKVECWGASGGDINGFLGGHGAYTTGNISLQKDNAVYIYVGQQGSALVTTSTPFNSGSNLLNDNAQYQWGRNGGGASDIRLTSGAWNDFNSLKSRIMVAAGGGGANNRNSTNTATEVWYGDGNGGYGGALIGGNGTSINHTNPSTGGSFGYNNSFGATQTAGGYMNYYLYNTTSNTFEFNSTGVTGHFGYCDGSVQTGGGGGYYAGGNAAHCGGSGGSSFISGYTGCNAIKATSTSTAIEHSNTPNHYSGYVFTNSTMIAGNTSMPAPGGGNETGHTGNGYARITFVSAN